MADGATGQFTANAQHTENAPVVGQDVDVILSGVGTVSVEVRTGRGAWVLVESIVVVTAGLYRSYHFGAEHPFALKVTAFTSAIDYEIAASKNRNLRG